MARARKTLAEVAPEVAREWHPTKNGELTPDQVAQSYKKKVWWKGFVCGHEWEAAVQNRVKGTGCPHCPQRYRQRFTPGVNDLASQSPEVAAEWHPDKNGGLQSCEVYATSSKKVWWLGGECGHEWDALISSRVKGTGCPVCSGRKALPGFNDLATLEPEVAAAWHPTKNALQPDQVTRRSGRKAWWLGACSHEWEATIASRVEGNGCPVCAGFQVLVGFNDLGTVAPEIAASWHPTKNGGTTPQMVPKNARKKFWWQCPLDHEWEAAAYHRARGRNCPYCAGKKVKPGFNDLATVVPGIASSWHPTKNGQLTAEDVTAVSGKKVWWLGECGHEWQTIIANRVRGKGCPVCVNRAIVEGYNDLATIAPKSAEAWHPTRNGDLLPTEVSVGSGKKVWWLGECEHEWQAVIHNRVLGAGCPVCHGLQVLVGFNDLATTRPDVAAQWHPVKNGLLTAENVIAGSERRAWWLCEEGHEWETTIYGRSIGRGCPTCTGSLPWSVAEKEVHAYVTATFPELKVHENYRTKRLGLFELDIYVEDVRLGIEFNGEYWHDETRDPQIKDRHDRKQAICDTYGVRLAIVWEKDWNELQDEVEEQIVKIIAGGEIPAWMTYARE